MYGDIPYSRGEMMSTLTRRFEFRASEEDYELIQQAAADRALDGWDYCFRSSIHRLLPAHFGDRVDRLVARLADHPSAIVGRFPGSPHAVTALLADGIPGSGPGSYDAGVRWRTWHAYPQDGRLVATTTMLRPRSRAAR